METLGGILQCLPGASGIFLFLWGLLDLSMGRSTGYSFLSELVIHFTTRIKGEDFGASESFSKVTRVPLYMSEDPVLCLSIIFLKLGFGALLAAPLILQLFTYVVALVIPFVAKATSLIEGLLG